MSMVRTMRAYHTVRLKFTIGRVVIIRNLIETTLAGRVELERLEASQDGVFNTSRQFLKHENWFVPPPPPH